MFFRYIVPCVLYSAALLTVIVFPASVGLHEMKLAYGYNQEKMGKILANADFIGDSETLEVPSTKNGCLPSSPETDDFLSTTGEYAYACGLTPVRTEVKAVVKDGPTARLPVILAGSGNFQSIRRFVYLLETGEDHLVFIDSVKTDWDGSDRQDCNYSISCSVYSQSGTE